MKPSMPGTYTIGSISELMRYLQQPEPLHPLIALVNYNQVQPYGFEKGKKICLDLYKVSFKTKFRGQVKYGQGYYDFEEGGLAFIKPRQIVISSTDEQSYEGYALFFHPDLIRNYPLNNVINNYGFFSYSVSEALFLSAKEKAVINHLFSSIAAELENNIDQYSQNILVSQIEQLLNYSDRFYNRQFITRKAINNEIITSLDKLLISYFNENKGLENGLPSVRYVSSRLQLSSRYLSDLLRSLTGQNAQQYIQHKVIEYSKDMLGSTGLSVAEIAYQLGFEHPQSFSKLFKAKTNLSPTEYRQSFN
ncbi:AraC family transcriptional regulator [Niastella vici]|uniref:AraC family transcriptional regulator n=1 Tax=Niastella vici TaxID=1703345 RepID=A0A1V9FEN2_9BACT|nr:helix-turn-helix domain-containing protein [Niastella vici]OQP56810.1 AraC family transcriptional regulator [Niastella vici]